MIEVWKPVPGYEGVYSVSDLGRVRSESRKIPSKGGSFRTTAERIFDRKPAANGYYYVSLRRDGKTSHRTVHSLVAEAFIGPHPGKGFHICHNNGIRTDNRLANLRYDTEAANHADTIKHGTSTRGEKHPDAKLTEEDIPEIRKLRSNGATLTEIGNRYGVSAGAIGHVVNGETWHWVA